MASNRPVRRAQEPVTYTFALCDSTDNVNWYCNDCQQTLCGRCKECHTRGKKTKNDDIVAIGKADRQGDKPVPEVCKLHPGKLCDVYCCDCDVLMCLMCLSQTHKQHNWKHFDDEFSTKKQLLQEHMTAVCAKIAHFKNKMSTRRRSNKRFKDNIGKMRKKKNKKRTKLKREVDYIADLLLAELSSLEKEESTMYKKDCQHLENKVEKLTRLLEKAETTDLSSISMFKTERSLRTALPLYDNNMKDVLPKQLSFVSGSIENVMLTRLFGELHYHNQYERIDIDSKHVQRLYKFTVTPTNGIFSICPLDENHAWLSIHQYKGLVLVNRKGVVTESVKLDFCPCRIAMVGTTDILMASYLYTTFVYKLSLHNTQVTTFADISPHRACDISINKNGEVCVSTNTQDIVVLNKSGTIVRKVTCGMDDWCITCLSSGDVAVSDLAYVSIIADNSGTIKYKWTGELDNGQMVASMRFRKMACDTCDRLFIPDNMNNQVYVLPTDGTRATCMLDQKHGVVGPTAVGVDTLGNVWVGCYGGTVHVMRL